MASQLQWQKSVGRPHVVEHGIVAMSPFWMHREGGVGAAVQMKSCTVIGGQAHTAESSERPPQQTSCGGWPLPFVTPYEAGQYSFASYIRLAIASFATLAHLLAISISSAIPFACAKKRTGAWP